MYYNFYKFMSLLKLTELLPYKVFKAVPPGIKDGKFQGKSQNFDKKAAYKG